jgi:hypothetical protein
MNGNEIPYFCWDRPWSVAEIHRRLDSASPDEWIRLAAWIMREAKFQDVWEFLSPRAVFARFSDLKRHLNPTAEFWDYILRTWHELGRV